MLKLSKWLTQERETQWENRDSFWVERVGLICNLQNLCFAVPLIAGNTILI